MEGGWTEDWVNSCSPGLTKAICLVSASITARCNVQRRGNKGERVALTNALYAYLWKHGLDAARGGSSSAPSSRENQLNKPETCGLLYACCVRADMLSRVLLKCLKPACLLMTSRGWCHLSQSATSFEGCVPLNGALVGQSHQSRHHHHFHNSEWPDSHSKIIQPYYHEVKYKLCHWKITFQKFKTRYICWL